MRAGNVFMFFLLLLSCSKKESNDETVALKLQDVSYGNDAKQKFDLYLPANRNSNDTKVLILIHGGGWTEGDKADFNPFITELQKRLPGYAFVNINYRLASSNRFLFPTQENDVKAAIEFIAARSGEYKISKKIALLGASAGGHLALLQAYKYNNPVAIKAVISLFGPTELVSLYNSPPTPAIPLLLSLVIGGNPVSHAEIYQQSSPLNFVTSQSCPSQLLHGGKDPLIPPAQSDLLKNKLDAVGVINEYVFYPNEGHGWIGNNLIDSFNKMEAFLKKHLQ